MALTYTTRALSADLTTVPAAQERLGLGPGEETALVGRLVRGATAAILTATGREFGRVQVVETVKGYGDTHLMLQRTPVVVLTSVTYQGMPQVGWGIDDPEAGLIYYPTGVDWTRRFAWSGLLDTYPAPGSEEALYTVAYWAGYVLPGDDVATATLSATAATSTYAITDGVMPLVVAGEQVEVAGMAVAANNGVKTVVSRAADGLSLVVAETLVNDVATQDLRTLRPLRPARLHEDVEEACLQTVSAWYLSRGRDPQVQSRTLGDLSVTYRQGTPSEADGGLPHVAISLLRPWGRTV